jgi:hypothetical protein
VCPEYDFDTVMPSDKFSFILNYWYKYSIDSVYPFYSFQNLIFRCFWDKYLSEFYNTLYMESSFLESLSAVLVEWHFRTIFLFIHNFYKFCFYFLGFSYYHWFYDVVYSRSYIFLSYTVSIHFSF